VQEATRVAGCVLCGMGDTPKSICMRAILYSDCPDALILRGQGGKLRII
jgi:hypothetical protein